MLVKLRNSVRNNKGFTLVELMVVIAILGILAAMAIPKFNEATATSKDAKLKADLRTVDGVIMQYYAVNNSYPTTANHKTQLVPNYLAAWPKDTAGNDLVYEIVTGGYTLKGAAISTTVANPKLSPGSVGYNAW